MLTSNSSSVQVFDHFDAYRSRIDVPESIFVGGEVCPLLRHFARIVEQLHDVFAFGSFALDIEQNSPEFFRVGYTEFGSHRVVFFPVDVHEGFCGDQQRISGARFPCRAHRPFADFQRVLCEMERNPFGFTGLSGCILPILSVRLGRPF